MLTFTFLFKLRNIKSNEKNRFSRLLQLISRSFSQRFNGRFSDLFHFERLPIEKINSDFWRLKEHLKLTAAGTVRDFHPIPSRDFFQNLSPCNRLQKYTFF